MHIFYLAPANSPHSRRWIRWFADEGHTITWLSAHPDQGDSVADTAPRVLLQGQRNPLRWSNWLLNVSREVRRTNPDLVHTLSMGTNAALSLAVPKRYPLILSAWGSDLATDLQPAWRRAVVGLAAKRARLLTCGADHLRRQLISLGIDDALVHTVNVGVDHGRFSGVYKLRRQRFANGVLAHSPIRIVSLRNFDTVYDHPTLLRAIAALKANSILVTAKLYGSGPTLTQTKEMARSLGIDDIVIFCGPYTADKLPSILDEADLYVSTATSDAAIAASTAEAMSAGLPVLCSDAADNKAWISDRVNGRLFPAGDHRILADLIADVAKDHSPIVGWSAKGRDTVLARFDYQAEMRKMGLLYEMVARR